MEETKMLNSVDNLIDLLPDILDLTQAIETANLSNAVWIRQANSSLKSVADLGNNGNNNRDLPRRLLDPIRSRRSSLITDGLILNRSAWSVIDSAQMLRETLRKAAFQAVFEEEIDDDLRSHLLSQARILRRSCEELNSYYVDSMSVEQALKVSAD